MSLPPDTWDVADVDLLPLLPRLRSHVAIGPLTLLVLVPSTGALTEIPRDGSTLLRTTVRFHVSETVVPLLAPPRGTSYIPSPLSTPILVPVPFRLTTR